MDPEKFSPFPPSLKKIGLFSPAARPDPDAFPRTLAWIRSFGVECVCAPDILTAGEERYFASDDTLRASDFNFLLRVPEIQLILCARGGYGSAYLPDKIDWEVLRVRNLPVCGYSDVTVLLLAMRKKQAGIPVVCQMAAQLLRNASDRFTMDSMRRVLARAVGGEDPLPQKRFLEPVLGAFPPLSGPVFPVNLSVLCSLCGSDYLPDFRGAILVLEDIDEEARKIDRMLLQLELNGILDAVAGVVFAYFTGECGSTEDRARIFRRFARRHPGTAFFSGLPFGHELPTLSFLFGQDVCIDAGGILTL